MKLHRRFHIELWIAVVIGVMCGSCGTEPTGQVAAPDYALVYEASQRVIYPIDTTDDVLGPIGLFLVRSNGARPIRLTSSTSFEQYAAWSPDGARIAYVAFGPENELMVVNADGSGQRQLISAKESISALAWSPDGRRIAFTQGAGWARIYVVDAAGGSPIGLTEGMYASVPRWSPDGSRILFRAHGVNGVMFDLWVMNADGSDKHSVAAMQGEKQWGHWSPDGRRVVFVSSEGNFSEVYVADIEGTNVRRLTDNLVPDTEPSWSPDGSRICFVSNGGAASRIHVVGADGTNQRELSAQWGFGPQWRPDGGRIAFHSPDAIYDVAPDGSDLRELVRDGRGYFRLAWSPVLIP